MTAPEKKPTQRRKSASKATGDGTPQDAARQAHKAAPRLPETPLNDRERLFVAAYVGEAKFNGAAAARIAGYSDAPGAARATAVKLKSRANVAAAIERATADRTDALGVNAHAVMEEMAHIAFARADMLIEPDGDGGARLKQPADIDQNILAAVRSFHAFADETRTERPNGTVKTTKKRVLSVTFHDKRAALAGFMEHFGLLKARPDGGNAPHVVIDFGSIGPMNADEQAQIRQEQEQASRF